METPARKLIYIPIIHTQADMGALGPSLERMRVSKLGRQGSKRHAGLVDKMWDEIERVVEKLPVMAGKVRVYQDGVPVCGHEQQIVSQLAAAGNRNHRLLLRLQARGAVLMGTESPELLVEEYQLATTALASGLAREAARAEARQKPLSDALLERRDRYIAGRINTTLAAGESGILLLGMLHAVNRYLDPDIQVVYPLRSPQDRRGEGRRTG
jgi:hypothetical protein